MRIVTAEGDGGGADQDERQAWQGSNWLQAASILGFVALIIALDWILNDRLAYLGPVTIGIAVGLAVLAFRYARRRSGRR